MQPRAGRRYFSGCPGPGDALGHRDVVRGSRR